MFVYTKASCGMRSMNVHKLFLVFILKHHVTSLVYGLVFIIQFKGLD